MYVHASTAQSGRGEHREVNTGRQSTQNFMWRIKGIDRKNWQDIIFMALLTSLFAVECSFKHLHDISRVTTARIFNVLSKHFIAMTSLFLFRFNNKRKWSYLRFFEPFCSRGRHVHTLCTRYHLLVLHWFSISDVMYSTCSYHDWRSRQCCHTTHVH